MFIGENGYTTGAAHDIEQATKTAEAMIRDYGMVEEYRAQLPFTDGDPRIGVLHQLILETEVDAINILRNDLTTLETLAAQLKEVETIEGADLYTILGGLYPVAA